MAGPMSLPAWAIARPENRVRDFFPASSKSASADLDQTAGARRESRSCDYDFAPGVHKYLYCQGNPVNMTDPSGYDGVDACLSMFDMIGTFMASPSSPAIRSVAGTGGPDVTKSLKRTLLDVQMAFLNWSRSQKIDAARRMRDLLGAVLTRGNGGAADAWDILPLKDSGFTLTGGYLIAGGQSYLAGSGVWTRTIAFGGRCYYAGAANYALWGLMNRLVYDWLGLGMNFAGLARSEYSLQTALHTVTAWKHFEYKDFGVEGAEAEEFTTYGFNGTMPASSLPCKPSGQVVTAKMFDWCWEPVKHRSPR